MELAIYREPKINMLYKLFKEKNSAAKRSLK